MLYIGIDLGTSAVKLLLMDERGNISNTVSREYPLRFPKPGWSEQDPQDWYEETVAGIDELLEAADRSRVAGISFGGQMHGLVMLDAQDRVIRPAILWNDGRAQVETEYLNLYIGEDVLAEQTWNIAFAGFTAPKILWVREHELQNFMKIRKIMLPKDYLCYRLCGAHVTDYSDASGMLLLDVKNRRWSKKMLQVCGIGEEQLPRLCESHQVVGTLRPSIADRLGLPETVQVVAGAADNAAAAIGTGVTGDGMCNISLGTSGTLFVSSERFTDPGNHALHSFCHADGKWHLMGCMLSAASCNKWWCEDVLHTEDYEREQMAIDLSGKHEIFFLPYLMGERSPHNDPTARAAFIGMSMDTSRCDLTQAVLEGVAFGLKDSLVIAREKGLDIRRARLCGGGAKSPLWREILSNVLDLELEIPEVEEGPSMGAAILAAVGCGEFPDVQAAANEMVRVSERVLPTSELTMKYDGKYRKWRGYYPALR